MAKNIIKNLKLGEISFVTRPAQSDALVTIMKSDSPVFHAITKSIDIDNGAVSFNALFDDEAASAKKWRAREKLWPIFDALRSSVNSIVTDANLTSDMKLGKVSEATVEFLRTMQSNIPSVEDELLKFFESDKEIENMAEVAELEKTIADLSATVADLTIMAKLSDDEKKFMDDMDDEGKKKFKAKTSEARKADIDLAKSADDVFKSFDGTEVRKSAVGAGVFAILKAQDAELAKSRDAIAKANEVAQTVTLTKRAEDELANLPGDTVAKVAALRVIDGIADSAVKDTFTAMFKAANEALAGAFDTLGVEKAEQKDSAAKLETMVAKYATDHKVSKEVAEVAVLSENPELYKG